MCLVKGVELTFTNEFLTFLLQKSKTTLVFTNTMCYN